MKSDLVFAGVFALMSEVVASGSCDSDMMISLARQAYAVWLRSAIEPTEAEWKRVASILDEEEAEPVDTIEEIMDSLEERDAIARRESQRAALANLTADRCDMEMLP